MLDSNALGFDDAVSLSTNIHEWSYVSSLSTNRLHFPIAFPVRFASTAAAWCSALDTSVGEDGIGMWPSNLHLSMCPRQNTRLQQSEQNKREMQSIDYVIEMQQCFSFLSSTCRILTVLEWVFTFRYRTGRTLRDGRHDRTARRGRREGAGTRVRRRDCAHRAAATRLMDNSAFEPRGAGNQRYADEAEDAKQSDDNQERLGGLEVHGPDSQVPHAAVVLLFWSR